MIRLFGKEFSSIRLGLFMVGVILLVSADLMIKSLVEKHWVRPWDENLTIQNNETLVTFAHDPEKTLLLTREIVVIEDFWSFTYVRNYNVGFSMLSFIENYLSSEGQKRFLKALQLIALILVAAYFFFYALEYTYTFLFILSGGIGNVIDRWYRGYVVDYVKWYIKDSPIQLFNPWPIFNLADSLVTIGLVCLIVGTLLSKHKTVSS